MLYPLLGTLASATSPRANNGAYRPGSAGTLHGLGSPDGTALAGALSSAGSGTGTGAGTGTGSGAPG